MIPPGERQHARRWPGEAARALGSVLWPGLEAPPREPPTRPGGRLARPLPLLLGAYALVVVVAAAGAVVNSSGRANGGVVFLLLLPAAGAVALAPRRPLDAWRVVTSWLVLTPFLLPPPPAPVPPLEPWAWCLWAPVLLFVGIARPGRETLAAGVLGALVLGGLTVLTPWPVEPGLLPTSLLGLAVPLVVGASVGARLLSQGALRAERARVASAQAERGALAERARIAREMHDVVAHHMSMIAVRCETAPYRLPVLEGAARTEIAEIGSAARAAMTDMQHLLGVLRSSAAVVSPSGETTELAPQPSLTDLAELVAKARSAELDLDAELDDTLLASTTGAVGLSAYRIAQEALTNARRHAPGSAVTLRLARAADALELVVRSAPGGDGPAGVTSGGGHGLVGMGERAALHGGSLSAGPDPDGGFTVRAVLPLPPEARG